MNNFSQDHEYIQGKISDVRMYAHNKAFFPRRNAPHNPIWVQNDSDVKFIAF